jgi:hypothetical protein
MPGPLECTESTTLPALDVAGSAVSGVVGILAVAAALAIPVVSGCPTSDSSCQTPGDQGAALAVGASLVALGTATAFSAAYGYRQTSRCREIAGWQAGCLSGLEDDCWKIYGPRARSELPPPPPIPIGPVPPGAPAPPTPGPPSTSPAAGMVAPPAGAAPPAPQPGATPQSPAASEPVPPPEPKPAPPPPPKSPFGPPSRPPGG